MKSRRAFAGFLALGLALASAPAVAQESSDCTPSSVRIIRLGTGFAPIYVTRDAHDPSWRLRLHYEVEHNPALNNALESSNVALASVVDLAFYEGCAAAIYVIGY